MSTVESDAREQGKVFQSPGGKLEGDNGGKNWNGLVKEHV